MKAGRELDALIAKKVMGAEQAEVRSAVGVDVSIVKFPGGEPYWLPFYSVCIEDAWQVVEKMQSFVVEKMHGQYLAVANDDWSADAPTAPLAICLAALKAVE